MSRCSEGFFACVEELSAVSILSMVEGCADCWPLQWVMAISLSAGCWSKFGSVVFSLSGYCLSVGVAASMLIFYGFLAVVC